MSMSTAVDTFLTLIQVKQLMDDQAACINEAVEACRTIAKQRDEAYDQTDRLLKVTEGWRELATKLQREVDRLKAQQALPATCRECHAVIGDLCHRCA